MPDAAAGGPTAHHDPTETESSLPYPVRVAAGALSSTLHTLRRLPEDLPGLAVELTGTVTKWAMSLRRTLDDLASRGDELLVSSPAPSERPAWATFDDESKGDQPPGDQHSGDQPPSDEPSEATEIDQPTDALAAWDDLPLRQIRALLPDLSRAELEARLDREQQHAQRPSVLTMLTNRLRSLEHDES